MRTFCEWIKHINNKYNKHPVCEVCEHKHHPDDVYTCAYCCKENIREFVERPYKIERIITSHSDLLK